jgi:hypothetical protein
VSGNRQPPSETKVQIEEIAMWRLLSHRMREVRSIAVGCCALAVAMLATGSRAAAQDPFAFVMKGPHHTYATNHTARTVVTELGTARSKVFVEVRNRRNEVVASDTGDLGPRLPFVLDFRVPGGDLTLLRTTVRVVTTTPQLANPAATLEQIGVDDLTVDQVSDCAMKWIPRDTPQTDCVPCPGWSSSTTFTASTP